MLVFGKIRTKVQSEKREERIRELMFSGLNYTEAIKQVNNEGDDL